MEQITPLVSIIVPNYNHEKYLRERLESIFNQIYPNFEVVLLDDCSTDKSQAILLEYADNLKVSHCIFNETNSGNTFIQWNKGLALAKGDYIWIAESDDFCELNFLEELIQPLIQDDDIVLSYCQSNRVDETGKITGSWIDYTDNLDKKLFLNSFNLQGNEFIERFLIYKNVIPNASGVVFRKQRASILGDLDIDFEMRYCGDWLFYIKLITNKKISYISQNLNNFRYHENSVIAKSNNVGNRVYLIDIVRKMREKAISFFLKDCPGNILKISKINRNIIRFHEYEKAMYLIRNGKKVKGVLLILIFFDLFLKHYRFKQNFLLKWNRLISKIKL
jgi:glycosyltransferase involved in cell wall biosynthesis